MTGEHENDGCTLMSFMGVLLRSVTAGILSTTVLALVLSGAALMCTDPNAVLGIFAYTALGIGALVCGIVAMRADVGHSIISVLAAGLLFALVLWIVSFILSISGQGSLPPLYRIFGYVGCTVMSLIGGLMGRPRRGGVDASKKNPTTLVRGRLGQR